MTRMVEENRKEIGTLKALGYAKREIARKYIIYALLSSSIGIPLRSCTRYRISTSINLFSF